MKDRIVARGVPEHAVTISTTLVNDDSVRFDQTGGGKHFAETLV